MLFGVALLNAALDHLLHDHVGVNGHFFLDFVVVDSPFALDVDGARGGLAVDHGVDAVLGVNQGEGESGLPDGPLVRHLIY